LTRGLRAAAAGMSVQLHRQDVHANNLANASTVGFRRSEAAVGGFGQALAAAGGAASVTPADRATVVDVTQGPIHETGNAFDLALDGPGMFAVLTPSGTFYTRDGRFRLAEGGALLTIGGHQVMGRGGPITLPGDELLVTESGQVFSEGQYVDDLFIAQFDGPEQLTRTADGLFDVAGGPRISDAARVRQGCLEEANVSVVREMAQMISGLRAFEAGAAVLRVSDQSLSSLIEATRP